MEDNFRSKNKQKITQIKAKKLKKTGYEKM